MGQRGGPLGPSPVDDWGPKIDRRNGIWNRSVQVSDIFVIRPLRKMDAIKLSKYFFARSLKVLAASVCNCNIQCDSALY